MFPLIYRRIVESRQALTAKYRTIGSEEGILEGLVIIAGLECILLFEDIVDTSSGKFGNLVATMAIENPKER